MLGDVEVSFETDEPKLTTLQAEIAELRNRLAEAQQTLQTIRRGNVGARVRRPESSIEVIQEITERKQAEEALRVSEGQFRSLADALPQLVWSAQADGFIDWYNQGWYHYTGAKPEQMEGWGWQSVHDPEALPLVLERWKTSIATGEPFEMTFPLRGADGVFRPFLTRIVPQKDDQGRVLRWFGTNTDVEALTQTEVALRESQLRTQLATRTAGIGIWEWNVLTGQIRWDGEMFRIYGIAPTPDGLLEYSDWRACVLPEDVPDQEAILQETVSRCGESRREFRLRRQNDGELRYIESMEVARPNARGDTEWVLGTNLDVTERRRAEADLQASEARFRGTFENAAVGVAHVALNGGWRSVNDTLCSIVGHSREELLTKTFQDITHPDDLAADLNHVRQVLSGEINTYTMDKRYIRKDGSIVWTCLTVSLQRRENGEPDYFISVIVNISEQKDAEAHRDLLMHELAHRSKNQLAVVQAIAGQSARHAVSLDAFRKDLTARIQGIAASTDLLVRQGWESVSLRELIWRQLEPFGANDDRLLCDGPDILLTPDAAQAMGLALHELATNCVKYGAWSLIAGAVQVSWALERDGAETPHLRVSWTEHGGPLVSPPARKGFGRVMIEQMVAQKLGGRAEMSFAPQGLSWTLVAPAIHVLERRGGETRLSPLND